MGDGVETRGALALVGKTGHQYNRHIGKVAGGGKRQRDAVHDRHLNIGEQQIEGAVFSGQDLQRLGAVLGGNGVVAVHGNGARHQHAHGFFIVGDKHARHEATVIVERGGPACSNVAAGGIPFAEEAYIDIAPFRRR